MQNSSQSLLILISWRAFPIDYIQLKFIYTMIDKKQLIYSLTLQVSKITLRVRFPCTICCTLKTDGTEKEITGQAQLHNGQALLNLTHIAEIPIPYKKQYLSIDKKCALLIYLKSSSGRIPAGCVNLPLMRAESRAIRQISRIDKCPDKNAFIEFEMKLQKQEQRKDVTIATTHQKESWLFRNQASQRNIKLVKSQSPEKSQEDKNTPRLMRSSQAQSSIALRKLGSRRDEGRSSLLETYYSGQRKIGDSQKVFGLQREIDTFKTKIMILQSEIATKNQRYSEIEKEMKQAQKKNENLDLQLKSTLSKLEYTQRANKQLGNQIKQLKERAQQQKLNFQNALKRLEIRQNGYKQQIKVVSEKLYSSQNEKQRMIYQKTVSSNEFEGRQKKIRQTFKEKQKKLLEQRTSMLKKIDSLQKDLQKVKQDITEAKSKHTDNIQQVHELKLAIDTSQSQKQRFRSECNDLKFQLTKIKNEKRILEENLESVNKFADERRGFRKQLNEKDMEISQCKDKFTSLQAQITRLKTQNEDLDRSLKEKLGSIKLLERDYNIIAKENSILMNDISDKQSKIGSLMEDLQLQMKRSKYLQGNTVSLQEQFESRQDQLERQLREFTSYKGMLEEEVDKLHQQIETSNNQSAAYLKDIQQLEQMLQEKNEWVANLESQMIQLNSLNQQWQMEKIELAEDKKELQESYSLLQEESQQREKQLNARITAISQKWQENSTMLQISLTETNQKIKMLNNMLKEKQQRLASSNSCNAGLQERISTAFREKQALISQKLSLNTQIHTLKNVIALNKKDISDRDAFIQSLRNSLQKVQKQNDQIISKNEVLSSDLKSSQASLKRVSEEFLNHRQRNYEVLDIINCNIKSTSTLTLAVHPDQTCNLKANQILMSTADRNKDMQRNIEDRERKIAQLQDELESIAEERDLKQKGLAAAGQHLELLKRSTNEFSDEITSKLATIKQLNDRIKAKQQEIQELETTNNKKILGLNAIISQKNRQHTQLKHKHDELEAQYQKLTLQFKNANTEIKKLQKQKKILENDHKNKLSISDTNLRTEMERGNILQADKSFLEKQLRQQRQNLRKVMRELQSKCYQFQDLQLRFDEHNSIIGYKESQMKRLKESNSQLKLLFDIICSLEAGRQGQYPSKAKMQKYLSEATSKQSESIKPKVGIYYENLTSLLNNNTQLQQKLRVISSQYELVSREQASCEKAVANFQLKLQEITQMREKQNESKLSLLKSFEEQKQYADMQRRLAQDTFKLLSTLEKQKKVSLFAVAPVKQLVKKLEQQTVLMLKSVNFAINKNRREWDLANIRAKKNNSKREETFQPPTIRP